MHDLALFSFGLVAGLTIGWLEHRHLKREIAALVKASGFYRSQFAEAVEDWRLECVARRGVEQSLREEKAAHEVCRSRWAAYGLDAKGGA